jgi:hypothetical protein
VHTFSRVIFALLCGFACCCALPNTAAAIGWGPTDFLIFGAPNFPDRIGVFDQSFNFKGYLVTNFVGVQGMNFDAQGRLVVFNAASPEIRVYDSSGAQVGGFTQATSPMLVTGGDVQVMPDGNYVVGTSSGGARVFAAQGTFVRQYGDGNSNNIAVLPGRRLWSGNVDTLTMNVFDTDSGLQVGSFSLDQQTRPSHMLYDGTTNTVLCIDRDRDAGGVFERDFDGNLLQQFHIPIAQTTCNGATPGPGGVRFGTSSNFNLDVVEWRPDGTVTRTIDCYPVEITATRILWAGIVPEPGATALIIATATALTVKRPQSLRGLPQV